ncbi:MAG: hypothetical protein K8T89_15970 [Planctomycetes bacterium]|nr:hypothetical protein [Planctomycetota bacterium]
MNDALTSDLDDPILRQADAQAVMDQVITGKPLDPEIAARVRERGARVTEEIRRKFESAHIAVPILREIRDEA